MICIAVTFPSVWLAPLASLRYYMPLFPCVACLVGIVVEGFVGAQERDGWATFVCWYQRLLAIAMVAAGVGIIGISCLDPASGFAQPIGLAVGYLLACGAAAAAVVWRFSRLMTPAGLTVTFTLMACFLGLSQSLWWSISGKNRAKMHVRRFSPCKDQLPQGEPLVSLGPAHHLFLLHLRGKRPNAAAGCART